MLAVLALLSSFLAARADTPAWCYDDQPQGTWQFELSDTVKPVNDQIICSDDFATASTKRVTLYSPNIAIDEDTGAAGTWTNVFSQHLEVSVGGKRYSFAYAWEELPDDMIHSYCNQSQPGMGWAATDAVTPRDHACLRARLVAPTLSVVDNVHKRGEPGPVNPDAQKYRTMPERRLPAPVPTGPTYRKLKAEGKLPVSPVHSRKDFSHKIFERLNREAEEDAKRRGVPLKNVPYQGDKLPERFDWRNVGGRSYVPPVGDQQSCGSCFTFGALWAMMARVMVASDLQDPLGQEDFLSIEHALGCNFYDQGCDGGFAEHVVKFAEQFGILTEKEYYLDEYVSGNGVTSTCKTPDDGEFLSNSDKRYFFTGGQLLGGYIGAVTDPTEIKWEIYRHGPTTIGVNVDSAFRECKHYADTESVRPGSDPTTPSDDPERHYHISAMNHNVLLVGWDVLENGTEVWLIQNSWGPEWCGDGVIRVATGSNEYGCETEVVTFFWWPDGPVSYDSDSEDVYSDALFYTLIAVIVVLGVVCIALIAVLACQKRAADRHNAVQGDAQPMLDAETADDEV